MQASNVELSNIFYNYLGNDNEADNEKSDNDVVKYLYFSVIFLFFYFCKLSKRIDCDEDLLSISQIEDDGEDEGEDEDESVISIIVIFRNLSFY